LVIVFLLVAGNKLYLSSQRQHSPATLTLCDGLLLAAGAPEAPPAREVLVFYEKGGRLLLFVDLLDMGAHVYHMPHRFKLNRIFLPSRDVVIVEDADRRERIFIGRWPIAPSSSGPTTQRWAPLLRSPLLSTQSNGAASVDRRSTTPSLLPDSPSTFPTNYGYMSTETQPTTFLSSFDPHRPVPAYADLIDQPVSALLARGDVAGSAALVVHSFPRAPADGAVAVVNERALYLRRSRQLLTLARKRPLKGTYLC
jgi:hypothetical protein